MILCFRFGSWVICGPFWWASPILSEAAGGIHAVGPILCRALVCGVSIVSLWSKERHKVITVSGCET